MKIRAIIILIFGLCVIKYALLAFSSPNFIVGNTISDDAYYYLAIARNCCSGSFPFTFDTIHPTNGFHFLYQVILIPFRPMIDLSLSSAMQLLLFLNELFFLIGSFFLAHLLFRFFPARVAIASLACFMLATISSKIVQTGMEASLAYMIAMIFLWAEFRPQRSDLVSGTLLGLLYLARADIGSFYIVFFILWKLYEACYDTKEARGVGLSLVKVLGMAALLILPLLFYYYTTFGHLATISSANKMMVSREHLQDGNGNYQWGAYLSLVLKSSFVYLKQIIGRIFGDFIAFPYAYVMKEAPKFSETGGTFSLLREHWQITLAFWSFLLAGGFLLMRGFEKCMPAIEDKKITPWPLLWFLIVLPIVHFFSVSLLLTNQASTWYWLFFFLSLVLGLAISGKRLGYYILFTVAFGGIFYQPYYLYVSGAWAKDFHQISWYSGPIEVSQYLTSHLAKEERVGSFNSGLLGFLTKQPMVINLDGLVNNYELLEMRKLGKMREYIEMNQIEYLADFKPWQAFIKDLGYQLDDVELIYHSSDTEGFVVKIKKGSK